MTIEKDLHHLQNVFETFPNSIIYHGNLDEQFNKVLEFTKGNPYIKMFKEAFDGDYLWHNLEKKEFLYERIVTRHILSITEFQTFDDAIAKSIDSNVDDHLVSTLNQIKKINYVEYNGEDLISIINSALKKLNVELGDRIPEMRDKELVKLTELVENFLNIFTFFNWENNKKYLSFDDEIFTQISDFENLLIRQYGNDFFETKIKEDLVDTLLYSSNDRNNLLSGLDIILVKKFFLLNINVIDESINQIIFGNYLDATGNNLSSGLGSIEREQIQVPIEKDFFISYASEDKEEFVKPLAEELIKRGYRVWYDEFELRIGDSLSESIDQGLAMSSYGIVVLSPYFFNKKWTKRELSGLVAKENESDTVILPIWHNIDKKGVMKYSPTLADKIAVNSALGVVGVVDKLSEIVDLKNLS